MGTSGLFTIALLVAMAPGTSNGQDLPENSTIWTAHENRMYYTSQTDAWTDGRLTNDRIAIGNISLGSIQNTVGLAFDHHYSQLVTSHPDANSLVIVFLNKTIAATLLYSGTSNDIGQLTIDWTARNLYWADGGYGWIAMKPLPDNRTFKSLEQNIKIVVEKHLDKPTGITIYPDKYFLFWADAGDTPKIERSNLVGGDRTVLIWDSLMSPTCLTIDLEKDRLYWSDQSRGTIEYSDFDGNGRAVLASNPDYDYYGVTVFQESLIFTAPNRSLTGFYSLKENILGRAGSMIRYHTPLYNVAVYDKEQQPKEVLENCDSKFINCDHICVHRKYDRGASCFCHDGYTLHADGKTCPADTRVLERYLLLTNARFICSVSVTIISNQYELPVDCEVVNHNDTIRVFALDMAANVIFFASGSTIFKQTLTKNAISETVLTDTGEIIDMDYDWISKELFWIISKGKAIHYIHTLEGMIDKKTKSLTSEITNIAVDPHNRNVYFISKGSPPSLNGWNRDSDSMSKISTISLQKPTDLEYNRLKDSLIWNDASGYLGEINVDGTNDKKYATGGTGADRHAVTVFKKFLISSTAEVDRLLDVVYERDPSNRITVSAFGEHSGLHVPILDMHVFDTTLQPLDLDPCEVNNGGCEHMCAHGNNEYRCSCYLGYHLLDDERSCDTSILDSEFFLVLDALNLDIYQIARDNVDERVRAVTINSDDQPSAIAFNMKRNELVWVERKSSNSIVKRKSLKDSSESAIGSNVQTGAQLAVDISSGNIYVTDGDKILVMDVQKNVKTIQVQGIQGTLGKIELLPEKGKMVWVETGSSPRVVMANIDGTTLQVIASDSNDINQPEDVAFDLEKGDRFYWCDSKLKKIDEVMIESLDSHTVYSNTDYDFGPVALDVAGDRIYFIFQYQRQIYQINKDGTGITKVMESPLFGRLTHLYVSKPLPKAHSICGDCNGGCSTFCLPKGKDKATCGCEDNIQIDGLTCSTVRRCDEQNAIGLVSISDCCNAECKPVCESGYTRTIEAVKCTNGQWNVTIENICQASDGPEFPLPLVFGAAGGGVAVLIIVVIVVVIVCKRRGQRTKKGGRRPTLPTLGEINSVPNGRDHPYDTGIGMASPDVPNRSLSNEEQADGGEYHYIDDSLLVKRVDLPDEPKKGVQKDRSVSGRYSRFPEKKDPYYLTPISEFTPMPDYPTYGLDGTVNNGYLELPRNGAASPGGLFGEDNDGYLAASSMGAPSQRGSDFSDEGSYLDSIRYGQTRDTMQGFMTSVPREVNGRPSDVPMGHLGNEQESGTGLMPGFDQILNL